MKQGLKVACDDYILNDATVGILNTAGTLAQPFATDLLTTMRKALTALQKQFVKPDAAVMNPAGAEAFDLLKDTSGRYCFAGPTTTGPERAWSVAVVTTPALAAGTATLADFKGSTLKFPRSDAEFAWSDAAGFRSNLVHARAEQRMGFGVTRPFGIVEVDLTA